MKPMDPADLDRLGWPAERLGEAIEAIGKHSGRSSGPTESNAVPEFFGRAPHPDHGELDHGEVDHSEAALERWLTTVAARLGLEAEAVEAPYAEVHDLLRRCAPALLRLRASSGPRWLVVLEGKRGRLSVLNPELSIDRVPAEAVRVALCREIEATATAAVEGILIGAEIKSERRREARAALLGEFLSDQRIAGGWLLRPAGTAAPSEHIRTAGLHGLFATLFCAYAMAWVLWLLSWWLLGRGILDGHLDRGWLLGWGLILFSLVPLRLLASYAGGLFSVRAGALLKRRLIFGAMRLEPEEIRHSGAGQLLGSALEAETVEQMAVTGGFLGVAGLIELGLSGVVLFYGAGGWLQLLLLGLWTAFSAGLGWHYLKARRAWTEVRLALTHDLVEGMVGHRTRVVQEARARWNEGEDHTLERYHGVSRALDRAALYLQVVMPRGGFIIGIVGLVPAFVAGGPSMARLAIAIGGVLLAYQAFKYLAEGLERLLAALVAWERIQPLWRAAVRRECLGQPEFARMSTPSSAEPVRDPSPQRDSSPQRDPSPQRGEVGRGAPLLQAHRLVFRHADRSEPVLRGLSFRIDSGDRLLLEGPSGGGKSTLGMLLAGQRSAQSGLCLLAGLDRESLGDSEWRRRIVIVPQFHENHVLMGTFAFNLLMGRGWPPTQRDLDETAALCRDLGLGPLLDSMPAGLQQCVGDTGWQLSHGERDRLYIARALLQGAEAVILDESLSALDPHTLRETLALVLDRVPTLVLIAHP